MWGGIPRLRIYEAAKKVAEGRGFVFLPMSEILTLPIDESITRIAAIMPDVRKSGYRTFAAVSSNCGYTQLVNFAKSGRSSS